MYVKTSSCPPIPQHPHPPDGHYSAPPMYMQLCVMSIVKPSEKRHSLGLNMKWVGLGRINLYIINKKNIDLALYKSFLCITAPLLVDHFSAHIWFFENNKCILCTSSNRWYQVRVCDVMKNAGMLFENIIDLYYFQPLQWSDKVYWNRQFFSVKKETHTSFLYFIKGIAYKYIEFKSTQTFKKKPWTSPWLNVHFSHF